MAEDVAALLKPLGIGRADFVDTRSAGGVALRAAIQHTEVVRRLGLISTRICSFSSAVHRRCVASPHAAAPPVP